MFARLPQPNNSRRDLRRHIVRSCPSWEKAAAAAIERASKSLRDLCVAQVLEQDLVIEDGKVEAYRTKLKVSFKYEGKD
ncbi:MAG TPA: dodecin family protein [Roseiarcus sp.]